MRGLKTYVINLESSYRRKQYMTDLLSPYPFLDVEFIKAIDGRQLSEQECVSSFDNEACMKHIGRLLNRGEIGCTLSHYACYKALLEGKEKYALILEDDIAPIRDLKEMENYDWDKWLDTDKPIVLFLSGDFWYYKRKSVVSVFDAVGAYAFFINRSAASLMLSLGVPYSVADAWYLYRRKGLKLKAVLPYMIDANLNMADLPSDVAQDIWGQDRKNMTIKNLLLTCCDSMVKKLLRSIGHFERKIRIINNVIVSD